MKNLIRRCKVIELDRVAAERLRERISRMGHPTLNEMTNPKKTVYRLTWLAGNYGEFRIERDDK